VSRYEVGVNSVAAAASAAFIELRSPTKAVSVLEMGFFCTAATSSSVGLGRPAASGVTPTTPVTVIADKSGDVAGTCQTASAWATPPTAPTTFNRRLVTAATIGSGAIWQWPLGSLTIPIGGSLVLWNFGGAAGSILAVYFVLDEN
jgi:hypothetical protein